MSLIHALGINQFAIVQFAIFIALFSYLTFFVFTPYFHAFEERQKRTVGGEDLALEYQKKSVDLHSVYQDKAREVHGKINDIFQQNRNATLVECDQIVERARNEANDLINQNRNKITQSIQAAEKELHQQTTSVALSITNKLLGK